MNKPTRAVRKPKEEPARRAVRPDEVETYVDRWGKVIHGVLEIDIETAHELLEKDLVLPPGAVTGTKLLAALDAVQDRLKLADKLAAKARRDYELYKEAHQSWLEVKKAAARIALEEEKKASKLAKQITLDMITDQVRATWPDEYIDRMAKLKGFQAAVHTLEKLADAWKARPRTLSDMKDIVLKLGA